jgi:predicted O-linked N-acetylglucosamine transferase (SPINDLY family)
MTGPRPFDLLKQAARLHAAGRSHEAAPLCRQALDAEPGNAPAHLLMGAIALATDRAALAAVHFRQAITLDPANPAAGLGLGLALERQGERVSARRAYRRALGLDPTTSAAYLRLARLAKAEDAIDTAIGHSRALAALRPDSADGWQALGTLLYLSGDAPAARRLLARAHARDPGNQPVLVNLGRVVAHLVERAVRACDWDAADALVPELDRLNDALIALGESAPERPGYSVSRTPDGRRNLAIARSWAVPFARAAGPPPARRPRGDGRIALGYVSSDLGTHAIASLVQDIFSRHDRRRFSVHLYSNAAGLPAERARRLEQDSDGLSDIHALGAAAAAAAVAADGIDLLIDLNGHTDGHRFDLFAHRPAPVQASWLGFPGTTGATFFDYLIADPVVAPPDDAAHYAEALALLPHSYQPNSRAGGFDAPGTTRAAHGLPAAATVFCCFNQARKIDRASFVLWLDILGAVPESVLWLLRPAPAAEAHLRAAAEAGGVMPERLVFAESMGRPEHLARLGLADLALDTFIYNGHTTTTDALWAGLPVLALSGRHFASRVSESLLRAAGLPELVAPDRAAYRAMAIDLAGRPDARATLRQRVAAARSHSPQFDTARFVADLERLYTAMWRQHLAGAAAAPIALADGL